MKRKRLPDLPDTGRRYVENTRRARLASPGVERFAGRRRGGARFVVAVLVAGALVAALLFLG
jgi:hypothetical protein